MAFFEFPHTRTYDSDLGWLIKEVNRIRELLDTYIDISSIKIADPITWDITTQYPAYTIVTDYDGTAYISRQPVPAGIPITDQDYWTVIFNYDDIVDSIRENIAANEKSNTRASAARVINDLVWLEDKLYRVTEPIPYDGLYDIGTNCELFTVADMLQYILKTWYLTPEQFGAVGDATTDDTAAIQAMFDQADPDIKYFLFSRTYVITDTIRINANNIHIAGISGATKLYRPRILCGASNITMFEVNGFGFTADGVSFQGYETAYPLTCTAFKITSSSTGDPFDTDACFQNCAFGCFNTIIYETGRNTWISGCELSQSNTVLHVADDNGSGEYRGYYIANNRFHGCGAFNNGVDCWAIDVDAACNNSQFWATIANNVIEKSYGLFRGPVNGLSVIGNTGKELHGSCLIKDNASSLNTQHRGFDMLSNSFEGFISPNAGYRLDLFVDVEYSDYANIANNYLTASVAGIVIGAGGVASIVGNTFKNVCYNSAFGDQAIISGTGFMTVYGNIARSHAAQPKYSIYSASGTVVAFNNNLDSSAGYDYPIVSPGIHNEVYAFTSLNSGGTATSALTQTQVDSCINDCYVLAQSVRCKCNYSGGYVFFYGSTYSSLHGSGMVKGAFQISGTTVTYLDCAVVYDDGTKTTGIQIARFAYINPNLY